MHGSKNQTKGLTPEPERQRGPHKPPAAAREKQRTCTPDMECKTGDSTPTAGGGPMLANHMMQGRSIGEANWYVNAQLR